MNRSVFLRQLRYWTFHCSLNALPSFCIAMIYLQLWKNSSAVIAMLCAIVTFILLYAALTSLNGTLTDKSHVLSRALQLGTRIRAVISGISLFTLPTGIGMMISPDFWCGALAIHLLNLAAKALGGRWDFFQPYRSSEMPGDLFLPVFATTLLEGFILSFLLLMISFFAVMFLQARDRRNTFRKLHSSRCN